MVPMLGSLSPTPSPISAKKKHDKTHINKKNQQKGCSAQSVNRYTNFTAYFSARKSFGRMTLGLNSITPTEKGSTAGGFDGLLEAHLKFM